VLCAVNDAFSQVIIFSCYYGTGKNQESVACEALKIKRVHFAWVDVVIKMQI
jgi:hypothetical protein